MANSAVILENIVDSEAITTSSEDSIYGKVHLVDRSIAFPFRFLDGQNQSILIDFRSEKSFSSFAILGHNFSPSADMILIASNSSDFSSPLFSFQLSWNEKNIYITFNTVLCRYVKFILNDAENTSPEIRELVVGTHIELLENYSWGFSEEDIYKNIVDRSEYGQIWVNELYQKKRFSLIFRNITDATKEQLKQIAKVLKGNLYPFVFIPDLSKKDCFYVRMQNVFLSENVSLNANNIRVIFEEEVGGISISI